MFTGIFNYFLHTYRDESLLVRHKAKTLLILSLFLLLIIEPILVGAFYFSAIKSSIIYPLGVAGTTIGVLYCLKKKRHTYAAQALLISNLAAIWAAAFTQAYSPVSFINKLSLLFFAMAFLTVVPMVIRTHASNIIIYSIINILLSFVYLHIVRVESGISLASMFPYYIIISVSFIVISFSTYSVFTGYWKIYSKQKSTEELLNSQNSELLLTNREYEKLNVELVASKVQILEEEERYRALYENALVGMMTIQHPSGIVVNMNETVIKMLGATRQEYEKKIVGKMKVDEFYFDPKDQENILKTQR